ncbi:MAG TPA: tetratricopeptide repeat protein, partial [Myxococcota bacterium]|nr:tetratricopeptide repeat protein [Myxococcota bacterium]
GAGVALDGLPAEPPKAPSTSWRANIELGWKTVERDPSAAAAAFQAALRDQPNDPDANYGYGYALLKLGDRDRAVPWLCRARNGDAATRREVAGLLQTHGLTCD